jgi:altronate dehydratase
MKQFIILDTKDNVATALADLKVGFILEDPILSQTVMLREMIPHGHKVALCDLGCGETVFKYGVEIGLMTAEAKRGELIHVHNLRSNRGKERKKEILCDV